MKKERVHMLVESAMLLTLGVVLELVSKFVIPEMPFGGQLTLVSMLPMVLISYRYGVRWGLFSGLVYSLLQMAIGVKTFTWAFAPGAFGDGVMIHKALLMLLLDYMFAYTFLGLGGLFRNKIKKPGLSLMCGSLVSLSLRYIAHILSGYILFASYAEGFFTQEGFPAWGAKLVEVVSPGPLAFIYSVVYNGMYMVPEIIITAVAAVLITKVPGIVAKKN